MCGRMSDLVVGSMDGLTMDEWMGGWMDERVDG